MFRLSLAFFLLLALSSEVLAQRGERGAGGGPPGQRGAGQRGPGGQGGQGAGRQRPEQPAPQPQPQVESPAGPQVELQVEASSAPQPSSPPEAPPTEAVVVASTGPGTVPQLATPADQVVPLTVVSPLSSGTIVPRDVPYKVVRYASSIFEKYDLNGNGVLEREEWSKMPGSPQSMDTDGDFIITLDEMIRHITFYGNVRTIHRPNPPPILASSNWNPSEISPFRPFSAPLRPKAAPSESQPGESPPELAEGIDENQIVGENTPEAAEGAESEDDAEKLDQLSYEAVFSSQFTPAQRIYHVPLEELRGVPVWFIQRDKNGDGQLSMLEYDPTLSPRGLAEFGRLDKNGDGFLTPDEVRVEQ